MYHLLPNIARTTPAVKFQSYQNYIKKSSKFKVCDIRNLYQIKCVYLPYVDHCACKLIVITLIDSLHTARYFGGKLPSSCPQNASRDSKKSCKNSKSMREFKSLLSFELSCKIRFLSTLQREGKSNPALSVTSERQAASSTLGEPAAFRKFGNAVLFMYWFSVNWTNPLCY